MAKNSIYAVAKGLTPGVYFSWDECKAQVHGYPGAVYRGFSDFDEAELYLQDYENARKKSKYAENDMCLTEEELKEKYKDSSAAFAFVDGSFYEPEFKYSYGGVLIHGGRALEFYEAGNDEDLVSMRNVAGEILGAQKAMQLCIENGISTLNLYFDYEGIEKWCTGAWKCKKQGTQMYKKYYDSIKNVLTVNFIKVKGHTGVYMNEKVDKLAKLALGIQ